MAISRETIEYVANLSRIQLGEDELKKFSDQLAAILDFIDKLKNADISNVSPTSHILPLSNILREDAPKESLSASQALANAPQERNNFYIVPKAIE